MCRSSPGYVLEVPVRRAVLALVLAVLAVAGASAATADASSQVERTRAERASSWS